MQEQKSKTREAWENYFTFYIDAQEKIDFDFSPEEKNELRFPDLLQDYNDICDVLKMYLDAKDNDAIIRIKGSLRIVTEGIVKLAYCKLTGIRDVSELRKNLPELFQNKTFVDKFNSDDRERLNIRESKGIYYFNAIQSLTYNTNDGCHNGPLTEKHKPFLKIYEENYHGLNDLLRDMTAVSWFLLKKCGYVDGEPPTVSELPKPSEWRKQQEMAKLIDALETRNKDLETRNKALETENEKKDAIFINKVNDLASNLEKYTEKGTQPEPPQNEVSSEEDDRRKRKLSKRAIFIAVGIFFAVTAFVFFCNPWKYYKSVMIVNGVPVGIEKCAHKDARSMDAYYAIRKLHFGNKMVLEHRNAFGALTDNSFRVDGWMLDNLPVKAVYQNIYFGKNPFSVTYYDKDNAAYETWEYLNDRKNITVLFLTSTGKTNETSFDIRQSDPDEVDFLTAEYDENGLQTRVLFFHNTDQNPSMDDNGCFGYEYEYLPDGRLARTYCLHLTEDGEYARKNTTNNVAAISRAYDGYNRLSEIRWENAEGQLTLHENGYALLRLSYEGISNRLIKTEAFGIDGVSPVISVNGYDSSEYEYDSKTGLISEITYRTAHNPSINTSGYASISYTYDKNGYIHQKMFYGEDGEPVYTEDSAGIRYERRKDGKIKKLTYLDADGNPVNGRDGYATKKITYTRKNQEKRYQYFDISQKRTHTSDGYSEARMAYDKYGNCVLYAYFDEEKNPVCCKSGYAVLAVEYEKFNGLWKVTSHEYYGTDGKTPAITIWGYAAVKYAYNDLGLVRKRAYFSDNEGTPASRTEYGFSSVENSYDNKGNVVSESYFGKDGNPTPRKDNGVSRLEFEYNEYGKRTVTRYFCYESGEYIPSCINDGYALYRRVYDACGYLKREEYFLEDGLSFADTTFSYSAVEYGYDEYGNVTALCYFDKQGWPTAGPDGAPIEVRKVDNCGNITEKSYFRIAFSSEEFTTYIYINDLYFACRPTYCSDGYFLLKTDYDNRGNTISKCYFDTDGTSYAIYSSEGYNKTICKYNNRNQLTEKSFYRIKDSSLPCSCSYGFAKAVYEYNEHGQRISTSFYDENGEPVMSSDTQYAKCEAVYDQWGNEIRWAYFDENGSPFPNERGVSCFKTQYDRWGNVSVQRFYNDVPSDNTEENKTYRIDGFSCIKVSSDNRGNQTLLQYFDKEDAVPAVSSYGYYAWRNVWDSDNNCIATIYLGEDCESLRNTKNGYSVELNAFNCRGKLCATAYLTEDTYLHLTTIASPEYGYAIKLKNYNDSGFCTGISYFDASGELTTGPEGYAFLLYELDNCGRIVSKKYYSQNPLPDSPKTVLLDFAYTPDEFNIEQLSSLLLSAAEDWWKANPERYYEGCYIDGVACISRAYDSKGNTIEERYFDKDGFTPLTAEDADANYTRIVRNFDDYGNCTDVFYYANEELVCRSSLQQYVLRHRDYDSHGNLSALSFYDKEMKMTCNEDGIACYQYCYDDYGNIISCVYLNEKGDLADQEYIGYTQTFDRYGNCTETSDYSGIIENETGGTDYIYEGMRYISVFDIYGREKSWSIFAADGKTPELSGGGYHSKVFEYDAYGNCITETQQDAEGYMVHRIDYEYDQFCNEISKTVINADLEWDAGTYGYAHKETEYDSYGRATETQFYDEYYDPRTNDYYQSFKTYDDFGNVITEEYYYTYLPGFLSASAGITEDADTFWYRINHEYNDKGLCTRTWYELYDIELKKASRDGIYCICNEYDSRGNIIRVCNFDETMSPVENEDGWAECIVEYDRFDNEVNTTYHGIDEVEKTDID